MPKKELRAVAILVGTTIGAGIFGVPFVVAKVGLILGILYLLILGTVIILLNLMYGEVILRTPGDHQLAGYGEIFLGRAGKYIAMVSQFVAIYGALLAYLIKTGEFLALIFGYPDPVFFSLVFFSLATLAIFFGLKTVSQIELVLVGLILAFVASIAFIGLPHISIFNYSPPTGGFNFSNFFLPYGVILFALSGSSVIPEMEEILRQHRQELKRAIVVGSLIPLFIYLIFTLIIIGISGDQTSDDAISGLAVFLPAWIVHLGAGLGILTMTTSFLSLGYVLREVWYRDLKLSKLTSLTLACFPALILFLFGAKNFIAVLGITGALTGGLTGILIIVLYQKVRKSGQKQPDYHLNIPTAILWLVGIIFLLGMASPWLG